MFDAWEHKCPKCHRIGALQWNGRTKILHCIWRDCDYEEKIPEFQAEPSDFQLEHFLANHGVMLDVPFFGLPRIEIFKISKEKTKNEFVICYLLESHADCFVALCVAKKSGNFVKTLVEYYVFKTNEYYYKIV
jgi:hypothetical protein